ncbi:glycoside hydrolase family 72 protein [Coniophora puteana RWD-64-598 SS2]|uniref:1,3-beta-glucanosyltransferase n=1 Tax=Coniophora puteana (strain RWD-64-598) TaxID=741705 RepID=A0A5M3N4W9_CONPW|nr:glycoside hydrolase family 72 protein [Coniophora puteana RWD-64-598 SS2]EIW86348.1 glycoside hydrolase family 72 protein [Coniophora puteana RWD-64-598 SS2]
MARALRALVAASVLFASAEAVSKVSRSGRYLYTQDGSRFYIKGIAYQPQGSVVASASNPFLEPSTFVDPLADSNACSRDIPYLQQLGVNTIRAYSVNSSLNHDACMKALSNAGIYTIIDLSLPLNGSIDRASPSWTTSLLNQYINTIDAFSSYDNVLAYNVGNEVVTAPNETSAAPFIKAAARDVKAYLNSKGSSALVGYAAIDGDESWRDPLASYLSCDPSGSNSGATSIDLYGLNNYEWCGNTTFSQAYSAVETDFSSYNVAAYFSEFGCITAGTRYWTEVGALFSSQMSPDWSGGIAFSYFPATSAQGQFGMVNISSDGSTVTTGQEFNSLKIEYGSVSPPNSPSQSSSSASYGSCPSQSANFIGSTSLPSTPNAAACSCFENDLSCQFTPQTSNYSTILGDLLNYACSQLGQMGSSCNGIAANGTSGQYGAVSQCDPSIMLSYVMSEYYTLQNSNAQACYFAGNGTVNSYAPSGTSGLSAASSSCLASATSVFTPSATGGSSSGGSGGGSSGNSGGAISLEDPRALAGLGVMLAVGLMSGVWTLV